MGHNCFFCPEKRFSLNKEIGVAEQESIIYEDDNVFIAPDISPLIVGHFLIVSKTHINSFAGANDAIYKSLERAKDYLINSVFQESMFVFLEHGAVIENSAGSSIDHAHVHGMPINTSINLDEYITVNGGVASSKVACDRETLISFFTYKQPYLYYEFCDRRGWAYPVEALPHQFFRMMIANLFSTSYNWKTNYTSCESKNIFEMTLRYAKHHIPNDVGDKK